MRSVLRPAPLRLAMPIAMAILLALLAAPRAAPAEAPLAVEVLSYGEYEPIRVEGSEEAPDTASGRTQIVAIPNLWRRTSRISASDGVLFGITVRAANLDEGDLREVTVVVSYPPVMGPDDRVVSQDVFTAELGKGAEFFGFCFGDDWGLNPGSWSIAVLDGERELARQDFDIVLGPALVGRPHCDPAQAVS